MTKIGLEAFLFFSQAAFATQMFASGPGRHVFRCTRAAIKLAEKRDRCIWLSRALWMRLTLWLVASLADVNGRLVLLGSDRTRRVFLETGRSAGNVILLLGCLGELSVFFASRFGGFLGGQQFFLLGETSSDHRDETHAFEEAGGVHSQGTKISVGMQELMVQSYIYFCGVVELRRKGICDQKDVKRKGDGLEAGSESVTSERFVRADSERRCRISKTS